MKSNEKGWGAIFDWDGVIVDSSQAHQQSWLRLADELQRELPDDYFARAFGLKNNRIFPEVLGWTDDPAEIERLAARKESLYREIIRREGIEALPGVQEWLDRLINAGIPRVVASSTERANIDCALELLGLAACFDDIVSADDVVHGKPDPEVFLVAAKRLAAEPSQCVVFEDALVGIEAGRAAGMRVVGVTTTHPAETLTGCVCVVDSLAELSVEDLWSSVS